MELIHINEVVMWFIIIIIIITIIIIIIIIIIIMIMIMIIMMMMKSQNLGQRSGHGLDYPREPFDSCQGPENG